MLVTRLLGLFLGALFIALAGSGCQTANGFGKDMENAGEKIQDGTR